MDPDILAQLRAMLANQSLNPTGNYIIGDRAYMPQMVRGEQSGYGDAASEPAYSLTGWQGYDVLPGASGHESRYNGLPFQQYDASGAQTGAGVLTGVEDTNPLRDLAQFAAMSLGAYGLGSLINGGLAGAFGGAGADGVAAAGLEGAGGGLAELGFADGGLAAMGEVPGYAGLGGAGGLGFADGGLAAMGSVPEAMSAGLAGTQAGIGAGGTLGGALSGAGSHPGIQLSSGGGPLSSLASALGTNAGTLGAIAGGLGGALQDDQGPAKQTRIDPRMDPFIYGPQGVLAAAQSAYNANPTGITENMRQGWQRQLGLLADPDVSAGYSQMRGVGQGLLGGQVANNPFLSRTRPSFGSDLMGSYLRGR